MEGDKKKKGRKKERKNKKEIGTKKERKKDKIDKKTHQPKKEVKSYIDNIILILMYHQTDTCLVPLLKKDSEFVQFQSCIFYPFVELAVYERWK